MMQMGLGRRPRLAAALVVAVGLLGSACSDPGETVVYVGRIHGTDATFALAANRDDVVSYVCGGDQTFATLSRWFCGRPGEGSGGAYFYRQFDGYTVDVSFAQGVLYGTMYDREGHAFDVSADEVSPGTGAGLYSPGKAVGGCQTGVIVEAAADGGDMQVHGTYCADDRFAQVTPVLPVEIRDRSLPVRVVTGGEDRVFAVQHVEP